MLGKKSRTNAGEGRLSNALIGNKSELYKIIKAQKAIMLVNDIHLIESGKRSIRSLLSRNFLTSVDQVDRLPNHYQYAYFTLEDKNEVENFQLIIDALKNINRRTHAITFGGTLNNLKDKLKDLVDGSKQSLPLLRYLDMLLSFISNNICNVELRINQIKSIQTANSSHLLLQGVHMLDKYITSSSGREDNYITFIGGNPIDTSLDMQWQLDSYQIIQRSNIEWDTNDFRLNNYVQYIPSYLYFDEWDILADIVPNSIIWVLLAHGTYNKANAHLTFKSFNDQARYTFKPISLSVIFSSLQSRLSSPGSSEPAILILLSCQYDEEVLHQLIPKDVIVIYFDGTIHKFHSDPFLHGFFYSLKKEFELYDCFDFAIWLSTLFYADKGKWKIYPERPSRS